MESPLQPSLLAPCSAQAVQLPVHPQQGLSSAGVGLRGEAGVGLQRMAEQASHTTRAGLPCPGSDPWLPSCPRPREQRPQEAQPWQHRHPGHVQLQQQFYLNEWVLHRALGALPGGLNGITSAHTTLTLTGPGWKQLQ